LSEENLSGGRRGVRFEDENVKNRVRMRNEGELTAGSEMRGGED